MFLWIQISGCVSERKGSQRVTSFPMGDINQSRSQMIANTKQDSAVSNVNPLIVKSHAHAFPPFTVLRIQTSLARYLHFCHHSLRHSFTYSGNLRTRRTTVEVEDRIIRVLRNVDENLPLLMLRYL